jgi:hypothetical protein
MAPPAADVDLVSHQPTTIPVTKGVNASLAKRPLEYSGSLDGYKSFEVTNIIGREYPELQLSDILHDDNKIRDLAITGRSSPCRLEGRLS